jgi:hypothetical protein
MALDRRLSDAVRALDQHELRQLLILAHGRLAQLSEVAADGFPASEGPSVSYRQRMVRCGKPGCTRCPHGPYWYATWREGDRVRTRYVGRSPDATDAGHAERDR